MNKKSDLIFLHFIGKLLFKGNFLLLLFSSNVLISQLVTLFYTCHYNNSLYRLYHTYNACYR